MHKRLTQTQYAQTRAWLHRNAREIDLALFTRLFEHGDARAVADALRAYQNADGGFGWALEADSWNPASTPITTAHAYKLLRLAGLDAPDEPLIRDIVRYFEQSAPFLGYGWPFCVPGNDEYPHAPWWTYAEKQNESEYVGVTADAVEIALRFASKDSELYARAKSLAPKLLDALTTDAAFGDMGLESMATLITLPDSGADERHARRLRELVNAHMERDPAKWTQYSPVPSNYIHSPDSPYYPGNEEIIAYELDRMIDALPENDVWPITWTWFDLGERYAKEFAVSETWWKAFKAIEKLLVLRAFDRFPA